MVSGLVGNSLASPISFNNQLLRPAGEIGARAGQIEPTVHSGPNAEETLQGIAQYLDASSDRVVHALESLRKDTLGEKSFTKGTLGALRKPEALDLYLAQGCGTLTVEVCPDLTDKELYHGLKRAYGNMLHALLALGWPVPVTNRLAFGLAGLTIGGRNDDLPNWTLTPADFLHTKREQLEAFTISQEHKCEK